MLGKYYLMTCQLYRFIYIYIYNTYRLLDSIKNWRPDVERLKRIEENALSSLGGANDFFTILQNS